MAQAPKTLDKLFHDTLKDIYFAEKTGRLYYIDTQTHLLSAIQVLHHKPFIPKPIADTLRLKKLEK